MNHDSPRTRLSERTGSTTFEVWAPIGGRYYLHSEHSLLNAALAERDHLRDASTEAHVTRTRHTLERTPVA